MTGNELKQFAIEQFGARGWQTQLAARLGIARTTLWRQIENDAVSGPVAAAVEGWKTHGIPEKGKDDG